MLRIGPVTPTTFVFIYIVPFTRTSSQLRRPHGCRQGSQVDASCRGACQRRGFLRRVDDVRDYQKHPHAHSARTRPVLGGGQWQRGQRGGGRRVQIQQRPILGVFGYASSGTESGLHGYGSAGIPIIIIQQKYSKNVFPLPPVRRTINDTI